MPIIDEPLVTDALGLERVGDQLTEMRVARLLQDQRALDGAKRVTLLTPPLVAKVHQWGER